LLLLLVGSSNLLGFGFLNLSEGGSGGGLLLFGRGRSPRCGRSGFRDGRRSDRLLAGQGRDSLELGLGGLGRRSGRGGRRSGRRSNLRGRNGLEGSGRDRSVGRKGHRGRSLDGSLDGGLNLLLLLLLLLDGSRDGRRLSRRSVRERLSPSRSRGRNRRGGLLLDGLLFDVLLLRLTDLLLLVLNDRLG
jgi:hypothetical protein